MSAPAWPAWLVAQPTQAAIATLDAAQTLNFSADPANTSALQAAGAQGTILNQNGAGGVNWYTFTLNQASDVQLTTLDATGGSHLDSVVSLYDTEAQNYSNPPINYNYNSPPFDPLQHRLMSQVDTAASGSPGVIERDLAAGTYYVAVSGQGDQSFNPFLADSGYAGSTGDFRLLVTTNPLPIAPGDGPVVLAVDSGLLNGPGLFPVQTGTAVLDSSPLAIYVDFSSPIDPGTVSLQQSLNDGSSVQLTYNPTGQFGNGNDSPIILNGYHYAADSMELQLQPAAPLGPGFYQLTLAGNSSSGNQVLMDPTDTYDLGQNAANPTGQDFTTTFQIAGSEGMPGASAVSDDTAATAHNLGNITQNGLVQAIGAIGDDPAYNPINPSTPSLANPASQVDLYHFQISGTGNYEFSAEVFAGRIGSTLDAALSLFSVDPSNTQSPLQLVASNDDSGNQTVSSNGLFLPLLTDPVLDVGLAAGDYYVAVSSSGNMPDLNGNPPGSNEIFDPNVSESGTNGSSTGPYVLNLLVQPAAPAPHVVSTSISAGATLTAAPTQLTVTFDRPVNLIALANQADSGSTTSEPTIPGVFIVEPNGQRVYPGLLSYDAATNQATFLMLDRLPNGVNQLHLSGANGLTGLGGNPLVGNDPSGDYVVSFTVADPAAPADPLNRTENSSSAGTAAGQDLGVLFPREVQSGVTVSGTLAPSVSGDSYTVQLSEAQEYQFTLAGPPLSPGGPLTSLPNNLQLTITDATGTAVIPLPNGNADTLLANLTPGSYTIQISQSSGDATQSAPYELLITMLYTHDNPPPLSVGATPVLQIRLASNLPPTPPAGLDGQLRIGRSTPLLPRSFLRILLALTLRADLAGRNHEWHDQYLGGPVAASPDPGIEQWPGPGRRQPVGGQRCLSQFAPGELEAPGIEVSLERLRAGHGIRPGNPGHSRWLPGTVGSTPCRAGSPPHPGANEWCPAGNRLRATDARSAKRTVWQLLTVLPETVRLYQEEVGSSPVGTLQTEETTATASGDDASNSPTKITFRGPLTWVGAIFSTALAAFLIRAGRARRALGYRMARPGCESRPYRR